VGDALAAAIRDAGAELTQLDARTGDVHGIDAGAFDAVVSLDAPPWMRNLDLLARGVADALVTGGRFVVECDFAGSDGVVARSIRDALQRRGVDPLRANPWLVETPAAFQARLERVGLVVDPFGPPVAAGSTAFAGSLALLAASSTALPPGAHPAFLAEVGHALRATRLDSEALGVTRFGCVAWRALEDGPDGQ
jgi:hypothetical protein